jgi:NAD(P)-dependent dehydrogenase (short-subunit alcohol dehydrogenase family)
MALAKEGARVCLGARSTEDLRQVCEVIRADGGAAEFAELDVSRWDSVEAFSRKAIELLGPPSVLVNNAGYGLFRDFDVMTPEEFDRQVDVTLKGAWYMTRAAVESLKFNGQGDVVMISSLAAEHSFKRGSAYCAAKAGLNAMAECLMLELREMGIRVTTICPGSVSTRFHRDALPAANPSDQSWMVEAETIAEAVLYALKAPRGASVTRVDVRPSMPAKK